MKKRLFSTLLMGAFFIASMSMFTSCKDYDDDLNNHESQIKALQEQIATLKSADSQAQTDLNNAKSELNLAITNLKSEITKLLDAKASTDWVNASIANFATTTDVANAVNNATKDLASKSDLEKAVTDMATQTWVQTWVAGEIKDFATKSELEQAQSSIKLWVTQTIEGKNYVTTDGMREAIAALENVYAKADKVNQLDQALALAQQALETKASTKDLQDLANKVAQIDPKLEVLGGRIDGVNTRIDGVENNVAGVKKTAENAAEAAKTAQNSINEQILVIEGLKTALQGKASTEDLTKAIAQVNASLKGYATTETVNGLATQLSGVSGSVTELLSTINTLTDRVNGLEGKMPDGKTFAAAINGLEGRILELENLPASLEAIRNSIAQTGTSIGAVQTAMNDAVSNLQSQINTITGSAFTTTEISVLKFLVEEGLTSIVLKPAYYLGGVEAIDLPMVVRQPEIFLNPNVTDWLDPALYNKYDAYDKKDKDSQATGNVGLVGRISSANNWVRGDIYESWVNVKGRNYTDVEPLHWPDGLQNFLVAKLGSYSDTYSYYREADAKLFDGNFAYNLYKYVDIVPNGHAYYHINPSTANLDNTQLRFYCNYPYMTLVTRDAVNEPKDLLYPAKYWASTYSGIWDPNQEHNPVFDVKTDCVYDPATGILDVPFCLNLQNYLNSYARNFIEAFDATNGYGVVRIGQDVHNAAYGGVSYPDGTTAILDGSADASGWNTGLAEVSVKLPFVAAQITGTVEGENRTVTSDYAIVTPSFLQILALADANADLDIAPSWTHVDHTYFGQVEQNHLYRDPIEAIEGEATHQLIYNDPNGINMDEFIQAHAYRFGTKFCRDEALTPELMKELNLRFEYTLVDWYSDKYYDSQSNHATLINKAAGRNTGNTIVARAVNPETGETLKPGEKTEAGAKVKIGETEYDVQAISSVGRQPLVRVMLVHQDQDGNDHILLKGYVKFEIVKELQKPIYGEIPMNPNGEPVFMSCMRYTDDGADTRIGGIAYTTWSQMERYILDKQGISMPKSEFDQKYMLEVNPIGNGAKRYIRYKFAGDADYKFYDENSYLKRLEEIYKTGGMTLEQMVNANLSFAIAYYKAFAGTVYYTGFEGMAGTAGWSTFGDRFGDNDIFANQQNVLYWLLGAYNSTTAHSFKYMGSTAWAPADVDMKYIQYIAGVSNDSKGLSTQELSTYVRFIPRNGINGNPIYVKLYIPAGKLQFANGNMANHKDEYWYKYQTKDRVDKVVLESKKRGDKVFEVHANPIIQKSGYTKLKKDDYISDLSKLFQNGVQFTGLTKQNVLTANGKAYFDGLTGDPTGTADYTAIPQSRVSFYFTNPATSKDNATFDAMYVTNAQLFDARANLDTFRYTNNGRTHAIKVWQTRGHSGKKYTLALAIRNSEGNLQTWQYKEKIDTKEVRDYMSYIYAKVLDPNAAVEILDDVKSVYQHYSTVERGTAIVAIREVGYYIPADQTNINAKFTGYDPQYEVIYKNPALICELLPERTIGTPSPVSGLIAWDDWGTDATSRDAVETNADLSLRQNNCYFKYDHNAIAEDILNAQTDKDNYKESNFDGKHNFGWGDTQGAFTAYVETVVNDVDLCDDCENGCYEIFDYNNSRYFNIRVARPIYMSADAAFSVKQKDADNKEVEIQAMVQAKDWRGFIINKDVQASYYSLLLDKQYYGNQEPFSETTGQDKMKNSNGQKIKWNKILLDEIRTDIFSNEKTYFEHTAADGTKWYTLNPIDVSTLQGRIYVNMLPVASKFAANAATGWNSQLDLSNRLGTPNYPLNTNGGETLYYRNIDNMTHAFNLYIPIYYSYVFGDCGLDQWIVGRNTSEVNNLVEMNIYGDHYWGGYANGYEEFDGTAKVTNWKTGNLEVGPYVYFKDRRFDNKRQVNFCNQDWIVIQIPGTVGQ